MNGTLTITGSALYFALSGSAGLPAEDRALLTIRCGSNLLRIDVPVRGGDRVPLSGQVPLNLLQAETPVDWSQAMAHLDIAGTRHQIRLQVFEPGRQRVQTGHVAGIDADGFLTGWSLCRGQPEAELPVAVQVGTVRLGAMTSGTWQTGKERAFTLNVAPHLTQDGLTRIAVQGACDETQPFSRGVFFATLLDADLLLAAPVTITEGLVAGAFQLAGHPEEPLRLELHDGDMATIATRCNRFSHPNFNFHGLHCGFFIRMPARFDPDTTRVVLKHPDLDEPVDFALHALLPDGGRANN